MAGLSVFLHGQAVSFPAWPGCQFPGMAARSFLGCPARLVPWVLAAPFGRAALGRAAGRAVVVALSVRRLLAAPPWPRLAAAPSRPRRWPRCGRALAAAPSPGLAAPSLAASRAASLAALLAAPSWPRLLGRAFSDAALVVRILALRASVSDGAAALTDGGYRL
jgi:hypothetical protein